MRLFSIDKDARRATPIIANCWKISTLASATRLNAGGSSMLSGDCNPLLAGRSDRGILPHAPAISVRNDILDKLYSVFLYLVRSVRDNHL